MQRTKQAIPLQNFILSDRIHTMAPQFSIITTCMGRLAHLKQTLPHFLTQPDAEVIVVDYSCPDGAGEWVAKNHPEARVLRIEGQTHWNPQHARNSAAAIAQGSWLCFIDADVIIEADFIDSVRPYLDDNSVLHADTQVVQLIGTFLCPRQAFQAIGGYDEVMEGWGNEDCDLYLRLTRAGLQSKRFPDTHMTSIPHENESRTRFHKEKNRRLSWVINRLYMEAKADLMRLQEGPLSKEALVYLYSRIRDETTKAHAEGSSATINLYLGKKPVGWSIGSDTQFERHMVLNISNVTFSETD